MPMLFKSLFVYSFIYFGAHDAFAGCAFLFGEGLFIPY